MRKPPGSLDAWAAYQRGLWHLGKISAAENSLARKFFAQAVDLDPSFAGGHTGLAWADLQGATLFQTSNLRDAQAAVEMSARRAVALDPGNAEARVCFGTALGMRGDWAGALLEVERALEMSPNLASAHGTLGWIYVYSGDPLKGLPALDNNIRLDPHDPQLAARLNQIAVAIISCADTKAR
jgi:adenylate cyclase